MEILAPLGKGCYEALHFGPGKGRPGRIAMKYDGDRVVQLKLKTARDLQHHIKTHGLTRHVVYDSETDWWWFANDRNRLFEEVFNSGSRVVVTPRSDSLDSLEKNWEIRSDLVEQVRGFRLDTTFWTPNMTGEMLADLFWTNFINQIPERYAYWDRDNPENGFEEYLFYREMAETGAHLEKPAS
jgi:hypothetical protein